MTAERIERNLLPIHFNLYGWSLPFFIIYHFILSISSVVCSGNRFCFLTSPPVPLSVEWRGVHPEGEIGGEVRNSTLFLLQK